MTTGDEIRTARQRAGLTQQELASKIGVSMRTIGNWERGETVTQRHAARIADVLGGHLTSAPKSTIEDFSDAALLAEIARRFDRTRSTRDRDTDREAVEDRPVPHGATTRTSDPRLTLLSDDAPELRGLPFAADEEKPGDDPGEDDD